MKNLLTITTCVNYADILDICAEKNRSQLDNWHIITTDNDSKTLNICNKYSLKNFQTNSFYDNRSSFNKGRALNTFLKFALDNNMYQNIDWILLLDSDIIINESIQNFAMNATNDICQDCIYGCTRRIYNTQTDFQQGKYHTEPSLDFLGYFQLFHISIIQKDLGNKPIFFENPNASNYDNIFRNSYFPNENKRQKLKDIVDHLGPIAKNWKGRKSDEWVMPNE